MSFTQVEGRLLESTGESGLRETCMSDVVRLHSHRSSGFAFDSRDSGPKDCSPREEMDVFGLGFFKVSYGQLTQQLLRG